MVVPIGVTQHNMQSNHHKQENSIQTLTETPTIEPNHVPLADDVRAALNERLQRVLAATVDLYLRTKQAHWNVRGPFFFARHELFDKVAEARREHMDLIAERIGTLGDYAAGSLPSAASASPLPSNHHEHLDGPRHLRELVSCYGAYVVEVREALGFAAEVDAVTEDILIEVVRKAELDLWFLQSHLGA